MKKSNDNSTHIQTESAKYRYVCSGCTNTALLTTNKMAGVEVTCGECGLTQKTMEGNYISL